MHASGCRREAQLQALLEALRLCGKDGPKASKARPTDLHDAEDRAHYVSPGGAQGRIQVLRNLVRFEQSAEQHWLEVAAAPVSRNPAQLG